MQESKPITDYRQALKERIVTAAMQLFARHGVKAVRMDDIAAQLSISKRTLYEIYQNKELLLFEGIKHYHTRVTEKTRIYAANAANVMDVVLFVYQQKTEEFQLTSNKFYEDLEKYPDIIEYLRRERQKTQKQYLEFMKRGVDEGYFRPDVNYAILSHLFEAIGSYMRDRRLYQLYTSEELFRNLLFVTLRGICTPKGVEVLDHFPNKS